MLGGAFGAIGRNWLSFLILTVVLYAIPLATTTAIGQRLGATDYSSVSRALASWERQSLLTLPLYCFFQPLFLALISRIVWADANKSSSDLLQALRGLASRWLWVLLASFLVGCIVLLGFILLIVPGVIAALALYVTVSACAVEDISATAAIRRSLQLTRGQRWRIFALLIIVVVITIPLSIFISLISMMAGFSLAGIPGLVGIVLRSGTTAIGAALGAAVAGSMYAELRGAKEGLSAGNTAAVFT